jgi:capsular exopolysaccharide synthesis family protein
MSEDIEMSRLQRAVAKAEREGLLTWTGRGDTDRPAANPTPRAAAPANQTRAFPVDDESWSPEPGSIRTAEDAGSLSPLFVAATHPLSAAGEQYRLLRTRLEGRERGRRTQLVLVTSPGPGDGKTTTSANLAFTMGQDFNHTVVLVEADLRRPTLAALCGVRADRGLADVLMGAAELDDVLVHLPGQNLFLLPAGQVNAGSTELLGSSMMTHLLDTLRARFDRIVIDSPPVTLADTHVLARLADGVLIIVRAGVTSRPALEHTLEGVERERLLGIVLNDVDLAVGGYVGTYAWNTGA